MECRRATRTTRLVGAGAATVAFVGVAALTAGQTVVTDAGPKPIPSGCVDANGPVLQVRVPASDLRFEYDCYAVSRSPGGVVLSHRSRLLHSLAIVGEEEKPFLTIELVTKGEDTTAEAPLERRLEPGTYTLVCQVHPTMTARLEVLGN